jgi:hypothetical protein
MQGSHFCMYLIFAAWRISCNTKGAGNATNTCRYRLLPVRSNNTDTFPTSAEEEVIRIVYSVKGTVDCYAFLPFSRIYENKLKF